MNSRPLKKNPMPKANVKILHNRSDHCLNNRGVVKASRRPSVRKKTPCKASVRLSLAIFRYCLRIHLKPITDRQIKPKHKKNIV